jgi:ATP-binding cassette subfamily B protein
VDQSTEQRLLREIAKLKSTLILVSHRPAALRMCDDVLLLVAGRVLERAPYDTLVRNHPQLFLELESYEER